MVYKKIKKAGGAAKKGGPNDKGNFKRNKIGQDTAKRMQDKLGDLRKQKAAARGDDDDEVKSNESDAYIDREPRTAAASARRNELVDDPFLQDASGAQDLETVEEKRLRMANDIIKEYGGAEKNDFFDQLHAKTQHEEEIMEAGDDALTRRMKMHLLEKKGKLFYTIANDFTGFAEFEKDEEEVKTDTDEKEEEKEQASHEQVIGDDQFERTFMKGHKAAITCMDWASDNKSLITGSKDCSLIKWDLET